MQVVYHCDWETLFDDLADAPAPQPHTSSAPLKVAAPLAAGTSDFDAYLLAPLRDYVGKCLRSRQPLKLLVKLTDGIQVECFMQTWNETVGDNSILVGAFDMMGPGMSSKPSSQRSLDGLKWLGLSLVHHEPSSLALPRFGKASVDSACVAVTYHAVHEQDGAFFFELDPFEKEPHVFVLGALGLNHMDSLYLAQARSELAVCASLSDHGFSGAREEQARVVLQKMSEAQAAPGGLRYIPEGDLNNIQVEKDVLRELSCHGLVFGVLQDRTTDTSSWQLTVAGMSVIQQAVVLETPFPLQNLRAGIKLEDMSFYELFLHLDSSGWKHI